MRRGPIALAVAIVGLGLLLSACGEVGVGPEENEVPKGSIEASVTTTGQDIDPDGYTVTVDDSLSRAVSVNESATFAEVPVGSYRVELTGVAENCEVQGANPRSVDVTEGTTTTAGMEVVCSRREGSLEVGASTSGEDPDPDGYTVTVDGSTSQSVDVNGTVTFAGLAEGDHEVELTGVADNCEVDGANPRTVSVPFQETASTGFDVMCSTTTGSLKVEASTVGDEPDPDGYAVHVDGAGSQSIAPNGEITVAGLAAGAHEVQLSDVAANCSVDGENPRTVTVEAGSSVSTRFTVRCTGGSGSLKVSTSTTGDDLDPDGYTVTLDGGTSHSIGIDASLTFTEVSPGDHEVGLSGVASNCTVDGSNPRTVSVPEGAMGSTTFDVSCTATSGTSGSGKIAFHSDADGDFDIYIMDPDGTNVVQLTDSPGRDKEPRISPDGSQVLFRSERSGSDDIWVMNIDGSNPRNVTQNAARDWTPAWGPDGFWIAFARGSAGSRDIYKMQIDGSNLTQLTTHAADDVDPHWEPSAGGADEILFHSDRDGNQEIYLMNQDGSGQTNLTNNNEGNGRDSRAEWSPDGTKIVWDTNRDGHSAQVYVMNRDGSGVTRLTVNNTLLTNYEPSWSPDGSRIVFSRWNADSDPGPNIFVIDASGGNLTQLTNNSAFEQVGSW